MTLSNPIVSASAAISSNDALTNDYLVVVVVLINRRESVWPRRRRPHQLEKSTSLARDHERQSLGSLARSF